MGPQFERRTIKNWSWFALSVAPKYASNAEISGTVNLSRVKKRWIASLKAGLKRMQATSLFVPCVELGLRRIKVVTTWLVLSASSSSAGRAEQVQPQLIGTSILAEAAALRWWMNPWSLAITCTRRRNAFALVALAGGSWKHYYFSSLPYPTSWSKCKSMASVMHGTRTQTGLS